MHTPYSPSPRPDEPASAIILDDELPGDLLQDALAVVHFPQRDDDESAAFYNVRVHGHLQRWGAKQLPDPKRKPDPAMTDCLKRLCVQSRAFIHDYLNKAVDSHLRQAYIQLPDWSHPCFLIGVINLPPRPHHTPVLFDSLSEAERRRVLKAFLRFEILSKVFCLCSYSDSPLLGPVDKQRQPSRLPCWSWDLLDHYECRPSPPREIESIQCVWEYVRSLYGAISARLAGIPHGFPDSDGTFSLPIQWLLEFVDGMETGATEEPCPFAADKMNNDLDASLFIRRWSSHMHCLGWLSPDELIDTMGLSGLDQVERLLKSGTDYSDGFFDDVLLKMRNNVTRLPGLGCSGQQFRDRFYRSLVRINRQRAWTFFDDGSRFPSTYRFPTLGDVQNSWALDQDDGESGTEAGD
ncbi:hypothetical protein G6O67_000126 [Ophiocordyceps sinensis]|uniref:Uncharacterized protein n=2 Tax=Ophiocordyceps sinensis TaxID=72228 RepID=A0A8H4PYV9_9HYPO|nr:hypothetical protein OCS_05538 [Ophiocordyceps sinensis CO18]KAF4512788.1 hypothetical protein G6O67_000126 [Ophiocordyceps sinensis]